MNYDDVQVYGGTNIVKCFSSYFSSVFFYDNQLYSLLVSNHSSPTYTNNTIEVNLSSCVLNLCNVLNEIDMITNKTIPGPVMIPSRFFKECKFVLASLMLFFI